jgi:hypothetical protein
VLIFRQRAIAVLGEHATEACMSWAIETLLQRLRKAGTPGMRLRTLYLQGKW